jgi:hypothetical protein
MTTYRMLALERRLLGLVNNPSVKDDRTKMNILNVPVGLYVTYDFNIRDSTSCNQVIKVKS